MVRDVEGYRKVHLLYKPNKHIMILGKSGYGKTFAANRDAVHRIRDGDKVIILDFTGSYTKEELARAGSVFGNHIVYHKVNEDRFMFPVYLEDISGALTDALIEAFGITSYTQQMILAECCEELIEDTGVFTFMDLFKKLEERQHICQTEDEGLPDMHKNTGYLLNKFRQVRNINNIIFLEHGACDPLEQQREPVTVLQLSDFSEQQKRQLSVFLLSLIWTNARYRGKHRELDGFDAVLIDEFQHFPLTEDSSFNAILREGRKYEFSAILCSQFLSDHKKTELSALTQAGTVLLFRPTENEIKLLISLFDLGEFQTWKKILLGLDIGEAVLIGSYRLDNGRELNKPLIVTIEDEEEPLDVSPPKGSIRGRVIYR